MPSRLAVVILEPLFTLKYSTFFSTTLHTICRLSPIVLVFGLSLGRKHTEKMNAAVQASVFGTRGMSRCTPRKQRG